MSGMIEQSVFLPDEYPCRPMTQHNPTPTTSTWYKTDPVGVECGCDSNSGYPITREWWDEHTGTWHTLKNWIKRRMHR
jgi:hypothetical protein